MESRDGSVAVFVHGTDMERMRQLAEELAKCPLPQGLNGEIRMMHAEHGSVPYRQMMGASGAKYKFYIEGTGRILNAGILAQALWAFQRHPDIGMIGLLGSKLPAHGSFAQAQRIYGAYVEQMADGRMAVRNHLNPCLGVEDVQNLDTHFLATQHDLPWPEDAETKKLLEQMERFRQLAEEKNYARLLSEDIEYLLAREDGGQGRASEGVREGSGGGAVGETADGR